MKQKQSGQIPAKSKVDVLVDVVYNVRQTTGYGFTVLEVFDILQHSMRKAELAGKGEEYLPILFQNELEDHVMRQKINKGDAVCVTCV